MQKAKQDQSPLTPPNPQLHQHLVTEDITKFSRHCKPILSRLALPVALIIGLTWLFIHAELLQELIGMRRPTRLLDIELLIFGSGVIGLTIAAIMAKTQYTALESLTLMRGVGVEISLVSAGGKSTSRFLPLSHLRAVIPFEHVGACQVRVMLGILVAGENKLLMPWNVDCVLCRLDSHLQMC